MSQTEKYGRWSITIESKMGMCSVVSHRAICEREGFNPITTEWIEERNTGLDRAQNVRICAHNMICETDPDPWGENL
jgi:hypothetical protein